MNVDIRADFASAAPYLHRLWQIGLGFRQLDHDWSHLKNQEDFNRIHRLEDRLKYLFEDLYSDGRGIAMYFSSHLREFNIVLEFPSLSAYVATFDRNSASEVPQLREKLGRFEAAASQEGTPWAVRQMIVLWKKQIDLIEEVNRAVQLLKQTDIYLIENGELSVASAGKNITNIGVAGNSYGSAIAVGNSGSPQMQVSVGPIFEQIRSAIEASDLAAGDKASLRAHVDEMASEQGTPGFMARYASFIAAAANHMTLVAPFVPALTALLHK